MSPERDVNCDHHGKSRPRTFACLHLVGGKGLGVCLPPGSKQAWPDAICNGCANERDRTHEVMAARLRLLCKHCWEHVYSINTRIEPHEDADEWIAAAHDRAAVRQDDWIERFSVDQHAHYHWQPDAAHPWIGFGESATRIAVRADMVVLGSWASRSSSWLWGWGNSNWETRLTRPVIRVKRFGEQTGLAPLWRMSCDATEEEAFTLAACALDVLPDLEGIYRAPSEGLSLFLGVFNTRYVI